jgi:hypothetical protein
LPEDVVR